MYLSLFGIIFLIYVNIVIRRLKPKPDFSEDGNNQKQSIYSINTSNNTDLGNEDVNINNSSIDPKREKQIAPEYSQGELQKDKETEDYNAYVEHIHKVRQ